MWLAVGANPARLVVTGDEPAPWTMLPEPDTPLAFCAAIVKLRTGVGGADVAAAPPPHAESSRTTTRVARECLWSHVARVTSFYYRVRAFRVAMVQAGWSPL